MVALGATIATVSFAAGQMGGVYWGLDLMTSSITGQGIMDHLLKNSMRAVRHFSGDRFFTENFVDSFSYMHLVSNRAVDLILSEVLATAMSMGISSLGGHIARKVVGTTTRAVAERAGTWSGRVAGQHFLGSVRRILGEELPHFFGAASTSTSVAVSLLLKMAQETVELVGEVVMELAIENMMTMSGHSSESAIYLTALITSVAVSGFISTGHWGIRLDGMTDWGTMPGKIRGGLTLLSAGLALSQLVLRWSFLSVA